MLIIKITMLLTENSNKDCNNHNSNGFTQRATLGRHAVGTLSAKSES